MPIRIRHDIRTIGAVALSNVSEPEDVSNCTKGILYLAGNAAVVQLQFSADGGSAWHDAYDQFGDKIEFTVGATPGAWQIEIIASLMRIDVSSAANVTASYFEGLREIG